MKNSKLILTLVAGVALGSVVTKFASPYFGGAEQSSGADANKPLYWVAPMDDNYRRDKPGKSPMGMDLVPVYAEDASNNSEAGRIYIAPNVVNNLGVKTAKAEFKPLQTLISTVGYVQYDQDKMRHIHTRVDGWIEQLFVKAAGDPVEQGEPLYSLYSPQLVNAQEEFVIALKRNNKALINAAKQRLQALHLSERFIKQLENSKKVTQTVTFYSPKSGVVAGLKVREGFYVNPQNTLMSIAQIDQVWVEAEVFERDAARLKKGLEVAMQLDSYPGKTWQGTVDYIYPSLAEQTRTLRARLKFDNPKHYLKPNMFAQVSIFPEASSPTMVIPTDALIRTGDQDRVVLAFDNGEFKSVAVTVGQINATEAEILEGIIEQDSVVTSAQFLIDSESSKSSDFTRLDLISDYQSAQVTGTINSIDSDTRVMNISRSAIEKWNRPAATMDFIVSKRINLSKFNAGQEVEFTFEVRDELTVVAITPIAINHSASDHPTSHHNMTH